MLRIHPLGVAAHDHLHPRIRILDVTPVEGIADRIAVVPEREYREGRLEQQSRDDNPAYLADQGVDLRHPDPEQRCHQEADPVEKQEYREIRQEPDDVRLAGRTVLHMPVDRRQDVAHPPQRMDRIGDLPHEAVYQQRRDDDEDRVQPERHAFTRSGRSPPPRRNGSCAPCP